MIESQRWISALLASLMILMLPQSAIGQDADVMCITKAQYWQAVSAECRDYKAKAGEYDTCRAELDGVRLERDQAQGQLLLFKGMDAERMDLLRQVERQRVEIDSRWHTLTVVAVGVVSLAAGAGVGWLITLM